VLPDKRCADSIPESASADDSDSSDRRYESAANQASARAVCYLGLEVRGTINDDLSFAKHSSIRVWKSASKGKVRQALACRDERQTEVCRTLFALYCAEFGPTEISHKKAQNAQAEKLQNAELPM